VSTTLHYTIGGYRQNPVLFLIHAMGADLSFWDACLPRWQIDYCCVAMNLRGAGASPAAAAPLTIEGHAQDIDELRRQLGFERLIPVGCAVGAMVAATYAGRHAEHCDALVLSNPGFRTRPEVRAMLAKRAADVRAGGMTAVLPGAVDNAFFECPDEERRMAYARRFADQDPLSYAFAIEGMLEADISASLGHIACPTLIVAGEKDLLLPPEHAHSVHDSIPGSELVVIESGAHFIPYQRPEEFAALVSEFLGRRLRSDRG
jgi:3-oxoadipate enol-lactonase